MAIPEPEVRDFFEVVGTQRAMRRLKPDPVPREILERVLWAATRAPSGGNAQNWRFLLVTDPEKKQAIQQIYRDAGRRYGEQTATESTAAAPTAVPPALPPAVVEAQERMAKSTGYLSSHLSEAPVIVVVCAFPQDVNRGIAGGASIYPAVQNLMLAARAYGLGTTLTTIHRWNLEPLHALLQVPETVEIAAVIPLGWPKGRFGEAPRKAPAEVTYWETWGAKA